jgi:outer membrane protein TolC
MYRKRCVCGCIVFILSFLLIQSPKLYAFDTLDELVSRAVAQNLDVAKAELNVQTKAAQLKAEPAWRSSSLEFTSTITDGTSTSERTTFGGNLVVPLTYWFSLGATNTVTDEGDLSSNLSATITPLAQSNSKASIDYRSSLQTYRSTLRTTVLDFRALLRSFLVSKAEVAYKEAELQAATAEYEQIQVLLSQGSASQAELLDALVTMTQARLEYETAVSNYQSLHQSIAQDLGLDESEIPDIEKLSHSEPVISESLLQEIMDRSTYLTMKDTYVTATLDAESSQIDARTAQPKPDITLKGTLSPTDKIWSASASLKLPMDILYWEEARIAANLAKVKQKQVQLMSQTVLLEYEQKVQELHRLLDSWKKTMTAYESAKIAYDQLETLSSFGQKSTIDMLNGYASLQYAAWQVASAEKSFRDALDVLSTRFIVLKE